MRKEPSTPLENRRNSLTVGLQDHTEKRCMHSGRSGCVVARANLEMVFRLLGWVLSLLDVPAPTQRAVHVKETPQASKIRLPKPRSRTRLRNPLSNVGSKFLNVWHAPSGTRLPSVLTCKITRSCSFITVYEPWNTQVPSILTFFVNLYEASPAGIFP